VAGRFLFAHINSSHFVRNEAARLVQGTAVSNCRLINRSAAKAAAFQRSAGPSRTGVETAVP
jgi:hypothetical protein